MTQETARAMGTFAATTTTRFRSDARLGVAIAGATAAVAGLATDFAMPRGPATTMQALAVMALGVGVGLVAGGTMRSRWAFVVAAVVHLAAIELGRLGAASPTVGAIRLDSTYGILAFVLGRGVHGVLVLLPMLLGVSVTRQLAARRAADTRDGFGRVVQVAPTVVVGLVVTAIAGLLVLPASTPPILGPDGRPVPGSIAELATVRLGGQDQAVMIRAADPDKPVLLYLSGGPGQSDAALSRALTTGWVRDFVFVDWEQRGNGKSYASIDPVSTMTLDRAVSDTIELTEYLCRRFGERKVYLMGESWGTILGVLAVQRRPDLYHAYIGSGQMVNVRETDRRIYADLVAYADETGDTALASKLREIGMPPYADAPWSNGLVMGWYDYIYKPYTPSASYLARGDSAGLDPFGVLGSEYSLIEKANVLRGLLDTFTVMYPQIQDLDFRRDVTRLAVPVYQLDGRAELAGGRSLALEWFDTLEAPSKQLVTFENAAHAVAFEQADEVQELLTATIVPATYER